MKYDNVYFFNGTAYAGKSTMVKRLAEKYNGKYTGVYEEKFNFGEMYFLSCAVLF